VTAKVNEVDVVPDPGDTRPLLSVIWCEPPLQLAARAIGPGSSETSSAAATGSSAQRVMRLIARALSRERARMHREASG
jgi:hypothetical protein